MSQSLLAKLRQIVGDAHVLTEGDLSHWELDWRRLNPLYQLLFFGVIEW